MKNRSLCGIIFLTLIMYTLSGCAMMFATRNQRVRFETATPDATIKYYMRGHTENGAKHKFDKFLYFHTVMVEKQGYKSTRYPFQLNKRSGVMVLAVADLLLPILGWYAIPYEFWTPKTKHFDRVQHIPALTAYEKRKSNEKYMLINNTSFNARGSDLVWHNYKSIDDLKAGNNKDTKETKLYNRSSDREDVIVDNTVFSNALNGTMYKMSFIDTSGTVFPNLTNSLYLNATVKKIIMHMVESPVGSDPRIAHIYRPDALLCVEMVIDWEVLNYYKQRTDSCRTARRSDLFPLPYKLDADDLPSLMQDMMADDLEYSLLEVRNTLSRNGRLNMNAAPVPEDSTIVINRPTVAANARMNDHMRSGVTIKVDEGHGSGVIISENGYIMTAYHVVAGSKTIEIILHDGHKMSAKTVRSSEEADLALLKVNTTGLQPLLLNTDMEPEVGIDVWAIGTPKSLELGQSVSKGILSAVRKTNGVTYIQTDASLNGGNSGGALISKDGTTLGIVSSKLVGIGTEGVGFAVSSAEIFKRLGIAYK